MWRRTWKNRKNKESWQNVLLRNRSTMATSDLCIRLSLVIFSPLFFFHFPLSFEFWRWQMLTRIGYAAFFIPGCMSAGGRERGKNWTMWLANRWGLWECGVRKTTSHKKGDDCGLQETADGNRVEKVESFKFLGVHITDKRKRSTHTDSGVKKAQQRLFNLRRLKKFGLLPKTLTNIYRCTIESILSGCITAWCGNCTTTAHRGKTKPPGHLQPLMLQEGQKDNKGQQPPEPLPVHPAIIQKVRSVQVHQSWDQETEKQQSDC